MNALFKIFYKFHIRTLRPRAEVAPTAHLLKESKILNFSTSAGNIKIGRGSYIKGELATLTSEATIGIGEKCYVGEGAKIWSHKAISIGNNVLIGHNTSVFDSLTHPLNPFARRSHYADILANGHREFDGLDARQVIINNDVWIGAQCVILRGVTIGEGSIVGAGAVVTKDIPPYCISAGNPSRIVGRIPIHEKPSYEE